MNDFKKIKMKLKKSLNIGGGNTSEGVSYLKAKKLLKEYDSTIDFQKKRQIAIELISMRSLNEDEDDQLFNEAAGHLKLEISDENQFNLTNHQLFLARTANLTNGLLLFHETGSGKTCTSLTFAKKFSDSTRPHLIICPENLVENFKKEIESGCSSSSFEFITYRKLTNLVNKNITSKNIDSLFQEIFSNRLIIIDECHKLRNKSSDEEDKEPADDSVQEDFSNLQILDVLKEGLTYSTNTTLILLSATPMYDSYTEIIDIMELLYANDKKSLQLDIYPLETGDGLSTNFKRTLRSFARKYVSFSSIATSSNLFPLKINPSSFTNEGQVSFNFKKTIPNKKEDKTSIKPSQIKVSKYELFYTKFSDEQYEYIKSLISDDDVDDKKSHSKFNLYRLASNILYSGFENLSPEVAFKTIFKKSSNERTMYEYSDSKHRSLFTNKLAITSPKIKSIIEGIDKCQGIMMIYSRYLFAGVYPLIVALEEAGFNRKGDNNFIKFQNDSKKHYAFLGAESNSNDLIKKINADTNKNGEEIKVVVISSASTEGLDLKCIREVHILEPWYNMSRVRQVIGRAIRYKSHLTLPESRRNVTIFLHCSVSTESDTESLDHYLYRMSEEKETLIGEVEDIIKNNSIDCRLNLKPRVSENFKIVSSRGIHIENKVSSECKNSKCKSLQCDFEPPEFESKNIDILMLDYEINLIIKYILREFKNKAPLYAKADDILTDGTLKCSDELKIMALDEIVKQKLAFTIGNKSGTLQKAGNFYLFVPDTIRGPTIQNLTSPSDESSECSNIVPASSFPASIDTNFNDTLQYWKNKHVKLKKKVETFSSLHIPKQDKHDETIYRILLESQTKEEADLFLDLFIQNHDDFKRHETFYSAISKTFIILNEEKFILIANVLDPSSKVRKLGKNDNDDKPTDPSEKELDVLFKHLQKQQQMMSKKFFASKNFSSKNYQQLNIHTKEFTEIASSKSKWTSSEKRSVDAKDCRKYMKGLTSTQGSQKNSGDDQKNIQDLYDRLLKIDKDGLLKNIDIRKKPDVANTLLNNNPIKGNYDKHTGALCVLIEYVLVYYDSVFSPLHLFKQRTFKNLLQ